MLLLGVVFFSHLVIDQRLAPRGWNCVLFLRLPEFWTRKLKYLKSKISQKFRSIQRCIAATAGRHKFALQDLTERSALTSFQIMFDWTGWITKQLLIDWKSDEKEQEKPPTTTTRYKSWERDFREFLRKSTTPSLAAALANHWKNWSRSRHLKCNHSLDGENR